MLVGPELDRMPNQSLSRADSTGKHGDFDVILVDGIYWTMLKEKNVIGASLHKHTEIRLESLL